MLERPDRSQVLNLLFSEEVKILRIGKISRKDKLDMKKCEIPDKEMLYKLYITDKLSMSQIAVLFNTSSMTVRSWLKKHDIKTRISNINLYHELRNTDFNGIQKDLIIGSVLGDGGLRIPKRGKNAYFFESHCEKQRMYLEWKKNLLKPFVKSKLSIDKGRYHVINGIRCNTQNSYKLVTISHPYLTSIWKCFYRGNGNKIIPFDIDKYINLFVIAVWVCDDGYLVWNTKRRIYRLDIHTENYSYRENVLLCRALSKFFKGKIYIIPRKYKSGIKYYITLRNKIQVNRFCTQLSEFVPECMLHKFKTHI